MGIKKHNSKISTYGVFACIGLQIPKDGIYSYAFGPLKYEIIEVAIMDTTHKVIMVAMIALVVTICLYENGTAI